MTEEPNKLADRLEAMLHQVGHPDYSLTEFYKGLKLIVWELRQEREPATEAVLDQTMFEKWWNEQETFTLSFACKGTAWNAWRAALKGKGASQGVAAETYRIKSVAMGPHVTGAAPTYTGEGVSMLQVPSAAPEPSGEGIFCCLCGKNIYSGEQTKLIDFDEWEAGVRKHSFQKRIAHASCPASTDEQKG